MPPYNPYLRKKMSHVYTALSYRPWLWAIKTVWGPESDVKSLHIKKGSHLTELVTRRNAKTPQAATHVYAYIEEPQVVCEVRPLQFAQNDQDVDLYTVLKHITENGVDIDHIKAITTVSDDIVTVFEPPHSLYGFRPEFERAEMTRG